MKRFLTCVASLLLMSSLLMPEMSAQSRPGRRNDRGRGDSYTERREQPRFGGHDNNRISRPGDRNRRPGDGQGYRHGDSNRRPGTGQGYRPGNGYQNDNRQPGWRPNRPSRPNMPNRPGRFPGHGFSHGPVRPGARPPHMNRPYRPGYAPVRPFRRPPAPPVGWRPAHSGAYLWSNILGITATMAINSAIDNLLQNGYAVGGYSSSQIYLSDVTQFGMFWPEAVMYYDGGRFAGGRFYYSTPGFDRARFDVAYNYLTGVYGMPVSSTQSSGSLAVTWYGAGNQYITLTFEPLLTDAGRRYFTTLSLGY